MTSEVEQRYVYKAIDVNPALQVFFPDDRRFLDLIFQPTVVHGSGDVHELEAKDTHLCGEDNYEAKWELLLENVDLDPTVRVVTMFYKVKGPSKDYIAETVLTRAAPPVGGLGGGNGKL